MQLKCEKINLLEYFSAVKTWGERSFSSSLLKKWDRQIRKDGGGNYFK